MRLKNPDCLFKSRAPAQPGDHRAQTCFHRIQRGGRINECDLATAPCNCQLSIQFIPTGGIGGQETKNCSVRFRDPKKCADKKSGFGFPSKRYRAKKHVSLDFSARAKLADLIGAERSEERRVGK